jgi:hypothetical protein
MPANLVGCQSSKSTETSSKRKWLQFTRSVMKTATTPGTATSSSVFTCANRVNGYYADPIHCHKFHYCGTGVFLFFEFLF